MHARAIRKERIDASDVRRLVETHLHTPYAYTALREKLKPVVDKHGAAIQATLNDLQAELAKLRK